MCSAVLAAFATVSQRIILIMRHCVIKWISINNGVAGVMEKPLTNNFGKSYSRIHQTVFNNVLLLLTAAV